MPVSLYSQPQHRIFLFFEIHTQTRIVTEDAWGSVCASIHVYTCMYMSVPHRHVYTCIYVYIHASYTCIYMYMRLGMYIHVCACLTSYTCIYMPHINFYTSSVPHIHVYTCVYMPHLIYMYIHVYTCLIYMYLLRLCLIYMYIHVHTCLIYMYIHVYACA